MLSRVVPFLLFFSLWVYPLLSQNVDIGRVLLPSEGYSTSYDLVFATAQDRGNSSLVWKHFLETYGSWNAIWNEWGNTPLRIWGEGYKIPGVQTITAENVEQHARQFLVTMSELLRIEQSQIQLVDAHSYLGKWAVTFRQVVQNVPVLFSDIILRMTDDGRVFFFGSEYHPEIDLRVVPVLTLDDAKPHAAAGLFLPTNMKDFIEGGELEILPIASLTGMTYRLTYSFLVRESDSHVWKTWVDANTGEILWRWNQVCTGIDGTVTASVKKDAYTNANTTENIYAQYVTVNGVNTTTDPNGHYVSTNSGSVVAKLQGPYAIISRQDGADAQVTQSVNNFGTFTFVWDDSNSKLSERTTFYSVNRARAYIVGMDTSIHALDYQMLCKVNINNVCNANFDGNGLNFFRAGSSGSNTCPNTGEMPDVVLHEYGHAVNTKVYNQFGKSTGMTNGAMQEGLADANAAMILDNSKLGLGFFGANTFLRNCDNTKRYPDDIHNEVHDDGEIIAGACWDLRLNLGINLAGKLIQFARHGKADDANTGKAFTKYFLEVLVADDNDGNLSNGTPNSSAIVDAFAQHGIPSAMLSIAHTKITSANAATFIPVALSVTSSLTGISTQAVNVYYKTLTGSWATVAATMTGGNAGTTSIWSADIPPQIGGSIIEYYIEAQESWGSKKTLPSEGASKPYRFLIGFTTLTLHEFETTQGWTVGSPEDDALTGTWVDVDPNGTTVSGMPVQSEDDHSTNGTKCWVTGNGSFGGQPGENDVDEGRTTLNSPTFALGSLSTPVIRYWRWFSNDLGAAPGNDPWIVQISNDNGSTWVDVENTYQSFNSWNENLILVSEFVTPTDQIKVRFIAQDNDPGSLVEAAVDDFEILYALPVPVVLQQLFSNRNASTIDVAWVTASETNNFGFDIEFKMEKVNVWHNAGFVRGNGTTTSRNEYHFSFLEPSRQDMFVRLRQIDFDGSATISPIVHVTSTAQKFLLNQNYPNPFNPRTTIDFEVDEPTNIDLIISTMLGQPIFKAPLGFFPTGPHTKVLDMSEFPSGLYLLELRSDRSSQSKTIHLLK